MPISETYLMDNMEYMRTVPNKFFQLAIADPPYGINRDSGFGGFGGFGKPIARKKYKGNWDDKTPKKEYFDELLRISVNAIIWGGQFFTDKLPVSGHWIFWDKKNTMPTFGDGELAYTTFNRNSVKRKVLEYNGLLGREDEERINATQKPVALYKWILSNYANVGNKIFDPNMGSQSSRIASWEMGFDYYGCENDPDMFNAGNLRFENYKAQGKLFTFNEQRND